MNLAIEFNNIGVDYLGQEGSRLDEAKVFFLGAAVAMEWLALSDSSHDALLLAMRGNKFFQDALKLARASCNVSPDVAIKKSDCATDADACYYVYCHGMKVHNYITEYDLDDKQHMISAIIVYNLALLYHLSYLQGPPKVQLINKSLEAYNVSLDLVRHVDKASMVDLCIVLLNNIGLIHQELRQYELATDIIERTLTIVVRMAPFITDKVTLIKEGEFPEMCLNIHMLHEPLCAFAA